MDDNEIIGLYIARDEKAIAETSAKYGGYLKTVALNVTGDDAVRHRLGALGFVSGMEVEVIAEVGGNFVIGVLGSRVAVDGTLARRILV